MLVSTSQPSAPHFTARSFGLRIAAALALLLSFVVLSPVGSAVSHSALHPLVRTLLDARGSSGGLVPTQGSFAASPASKQKSQFYAVKGGFATKDALGGFVATFVQKSVTVASDRKSKWSEGITLTSFGRSSLTKLKAVKPVVAGQGLEYKFRQLSDLYSNGPGGLEQSIVIPKLVGGPTTMPVTVAVTVSGKLSASVRSSGRIVVFKQGAKTVLSYAGLWARDKTGRALPAKVFISGNSLAIAVNDANAAYPITIDPYFFANELVAADSAAGDYFGGSVAMTSDGSTALVGALDHSHTGGAYVFQRDGTSYDQIQELAPSDLQPGDGFGWSVALSADGDMAVVGAPGGGDPGVTTLPVGKLYVFMRNGSSFAQTQEISPQGLPAGRQFGFIVALSADGSIMLAQAQGIVYVYRLDVSTYELAQTLTASDVAGTCQGSSFGGSVAIAGDGNTIFVGAPGCFSNRGALNIFALSNGSYQYSQTVVASDGHSGDNFGTVATDYAGDVLVVGAFGHSSGTDPIHQYAGAAYVFTQNGSTYLQSAELTSPDGYSGDQFGGSITMSSDGNVIMVGALYHPGILCSGTSISTCQGYFGPGAAYVFTWNGAAWVDTNGLAAYDGDNGDEFGESVALSSDGGIALVGTATHNNWAGSAYVYGPTGAPATTGVTLTAGTNPSTYGDSLTFSATVGPNVTPTPTGDVTFWAGPPSDPGSVDLGAVPVDNLTAILTTSQVPAGHAGVYAVYGGSPSFAGSQDSEAQTVNPAPMTITADDQSVAVGSPLPTFTFEAQGFVNGESAADFSQPPHCTTTATVDGQGNVNSLPGTYPITCSGGLDSNYAVTYVAGTLTVTG
jgi:hypothetical protein